MPEAASKRRSKSCAASSAMRARFNQTAASATTSVMRPLPVIVGVLEAGPPLPASNTFPPSADFAIPPATEIDAY
ncbi:hypothetical protein GCM10023217_24630 [Gordonia alkaliphila]|uniref:Uncharacterized protein n=1 Tax=Gordonia alkaliphila TaxID=1053547 RepID=A0ABP8ZCH3_9ACTN